VRRIVPSVLLSLLLVPWAPELRAQQRPSKAHPGTLVDAYTRKGILARAYAYSSQYLETADDCPVYKDALDEEKSRIPAGSFAFHIPASESSYLAVYCQQGYFSRTETVNSNLADGTRVQPDPVKLIPLGTRLPAGVKLSSVIFKAMASDLEELRRNFRYYKKASPTSFSDALKLRLSPADRGMVDALTNRTRPFGPAIGIGPTGQSVEPDSVDVAFVATATDIDDAHADFVYFDRVNNDAYAAARSKFAPQDQAIVDRIRMASPYHVSAERH
jgi:hypothetical protein